MTPNNEPVAYGGIISAVAIAAIPFLRSIGVNISKDQADSALALLSALTLAGTVILRSRVTPTPKAQAAVETALTVPAPTTDEATKATAAGILATAKP